MFPRQVEAIITYLGEGALITVLLTALPQHSVQANCSARWQTAYAIPTNLYRLCTEKRRVHAATAQRPMQGRINSSCFRLHSVQSGGAGRCCLPSETQARTLNDLGAHTLMELIRAPAGLSSTFSALSKLKTKCSRSHTAQPRLRADSSLLGSGTSPAVLAGEHENA